METKANYVLIGAFTLGVVAFALLFALWAARWSSQQAWDVYDVVFNEAVTGLSEGGTVQYNGIAVGTVEDLSLMPNAMPLYWTDAPSESPVTASVNTTSYMSQACCDDQRAAHSANSSRKATTPRVKAPMRT